MAKEFKAIDNPARLDQLRRLYDKANSAKEIGEANEAQAFFNHITRLCRKYNLTMKDIEGHEIVDMDNTITHIPFEKAIPLTPISSDGDWLVHLISGISRACMCKIILKGSDNNQSCIIIGTRHNIDTTLYIFDAASVMFKHFSSRDFNNERKEAKEKVAKIYPVGQFDVERAVYDISDSIWRMSDKRSSYEIMDYLRKDHYAALQVKSVPDGTYITVKNPEQAGLISWRKVWVRSYLHAAAKAFSEKLQDDMCKHEVEDTNVRALVKTNQIAVVDYIDRHFSTVKVKLSRNDHDQRAAEKGAKVGRSFNIGKPIPGQSGGIKRLS